MCVQNIYAVCEHNNFNAWRFRNNIINIAATQISAGVDVGISGHSGEKKGDEQFEISDPRNVEEVYKAIEEQGLQPVMSDYIYV